MTGRSVQLSAGGVRIGSVSGNHIVLSDPAISRHHAEIRQVGADYWVRDLDSTNGVYHRAVRVSQARLADGDRLRMGNSEVVFQLGMARGTGAITL
jgi:pSer/pThr/pTyr-binding forkhead associated (FHA) protein